MPHTHQTAPKKTEPKALTAENKSRSAATPKTTPAWANALGSQPALTLQPKLTVNQPGDEYEEEADHVAAQVMRMATPAVTQVQRCACGGVAGPDGECATCKAKRLGLQRKADGIAHTEAPPSVHQTIHSSGQPLDAGTRAYMEPRFGQDFSNVRVHTDSQAAQSAADVSARAYTVGNNVVFGAGEYKAGTNDGQQLIAHELTHVIQQNTGQVSRLSEMDSAIDNEDFVEEDEIVGTDGESDQEIVIDGDSSTGTVFSVGELSLEQMMGNSGDTNSDVETIGDESGLMTLSRKAIGNILLREKSPPPDTSDKKWVTKVNINLTKQTLQIEWSDGSIEKPVPISSGRGCPNTKGNPCADPNLDNSYCTPTGSYTVQALGGEDYKNSHGDAMSWYVEFVSARGIGIHDSQPVTGHPASHGCVRVGSKTAKLIHQNVTKKTVIEASGKAPTKSWVKSNLKGYIGCPAPLKKKKSKTTKTNLPAVNRLQRETKSGLKPTDIRADSDIEAQRLEAIKIITDNCTHIAKAAKDYNIIPEAIAGAVLWEALENPYKRSFARLGPGKVHYHGSDEESEKVEKEGLVTPPSKDKDERGERLHQSQWAITYIAAIMRRHANNYKNIAGVDISANVGVLCTLYQGGNSEARAAKLAERRRIDPNAQPKAGDEMGPWVEAEIKWIQSIFTCPMPRPKSSAPEPPKSSPAPAPGVFPPSLPPPKKAELDFPANTEDAYAEEIDENSAIA